MTVEHGRAPKVESQRSGAALKTNAKPSSESGGGKSGNPAGFADVLASAAMDEPTPTDACQTSESAVLQDKLDRGKPRNEAPALPVANPSPVPVKDSREDALTRADGKKAKRTDGTDGAVTAGAGLPELLSIQLPLAGAVNDPDSAMRASEGGATDARAKLVAAASGNRGLVSTFQMQQHFNSGGARGPLKLNEAVASGKDGVGDVLQSDASSAGASRLEAVMGALAKPTSPAQAESSKPASLMELVGSLTSDHPFSPSTRERDTTTTVYGAPTLEQPKSEGSLDGIGAHTVAADAEEVSTADTVRFWIGSEQTQQADMKVVDVGGGAVDVSIRLNGKEAHVVFRAEESTARDALQAGGGQLKDLLGQGGLTLSGMSVGTSAGDGSQSRGKQSADKAPNGISKLVRVEVGNVTGSGHAGGGLSGAMSNGRGIDFYV